MKNFCSLVLATALLGSACTITYRDPFGGTTTLGFPDNPGPQEAAEAFDMLEKAMADNLKAMREAVVSGNRELLDLASANIERIGDAKVKLKPYLPA